ncbi:hypothetical protein FOA52_008551 [Chlamydomonas sp. UWO 241]|nr:hypothetical protein FOA52_008551 [Chlamydomonas sp. UWO 241]
MPSIALLSSSSSVAARASVPRRPSVTVRAHNETAAVPANVVEARAWISSWRAASQHAAPAAAAPAAAAPAAAAAAAAGGRFSPAMTTADGMMVFSGASLASVSFQEGMAAAEARSK